MLSKVHVIIEADGITIQDKGSHNGTKKEIRRTERTRVCGVVIAKFQLWVRLGTTIVRTSHLTLFQRLLRL